MQLNGCRRNRWVFAKGEKRTVPVSHLGSLKKNNKQIVYITVANAISLDCDCDENQGDPVIKDIGIFASVDPVANDQAFIDAIWKTHEEGTKDIKERIDTRFGRHITEYAEELGFGTCNYELIEL